jgi:hypothetical protein
MPGCVELATAWPSSANYRVSGDHPCLPCPPPTASAADREAFDDAGAEVDDEGIDEAEDELALREGTQAEWAFFEMFAPEVSQTDLRTRIDEYFDRANANYDLGHTTVRAGPSSATRGAAIPRRRRPKSGAFWEQPSRGAIPGRFTRRPMAEPRRAR